jgi:hypothetical protein
MCEIIGGLWLSPGRFDLAIAEYQVKCRITSRPLARRVQGFKESYERRSLCWTEVVSISRHVAAALNDLPNELVLGEAHGNTI